MHATLRTLAERVREAAVLEALKARVKVAEAGADDAGARVVPAVAQGGQELHLRADVLDAGLSIAQHTVAQLHKS